MSANNIAAAQNVVASPKRKCMDHNQASRVSRKSELQLFPTHPEPQEFVHVSTATKIKSSGQNLQSFTGALESDHSNPKHCHSFLLNNAQAPWEAKDPVESAFKYQAEEGAAIIFAKKDLEMAHMQNLITDLKEKVASVSTEVNHLHEVIKNKDAELANLKRKNVELEQMQFHYKSDTQIWKQRAEKAEVLLWNCTNSPRPYSACEEEDTASSISGGKVMKGVAVCKVCGKGVAMWPCRHLCICRECDVPQKSTRRCPMCNLLSIRLEV